MKKIFLSLLIFLISVPSVNALTFKDAKNLMDEKRFRLAVSAFDEILKKQPDNADGYYHRSYCYLQLKDYKSGVNDCMKAIIYHPKLYETIGVDTLLDVAVEIYPRDRENAIYLINSAIDFRHESKREDLFYSVNNKILSSLDKSISEKKIRKAEEYLSLINVYSTEETKIEKSKIEIRHQQIKKLKLDRKMAMNKITPIKLEEHPQLAYSEKIRKLVKKNITPLNRMKGINPNLEVGIEFEISQAGEIKRLKVGKSSGNSYFDEVAKKTIIKTGKFPPLPYGMKPYKTGCIFRAESFQ